MSEAQEQTFNENIRLAHWVAHRYGHGILPLLDDRIQAARIGLWKAILHYDPTKAKLTTFAVHVMINEILHAGKDEKPTGTVHVADDNLWLRPVYIEDVQAALENSRSRRLKRRFEQVVVVALTDPKDGPEAALLRQEENAALSTFAAKVTRKRTRKGATWTASDVATLIDQGLRPAEVARRFDVSRERIRQIIAEIRTERAKKEGGG